MSYEIIEHIEKSEGIHFLQCPMCKEWFDRGESKEFFKHIHGLNDLANLQANAKAAKHEHYIEKSRVLMPV